MTWQQIERAFNRSLYYAFSRKQLLFTFPTLILCGVLVVFCKALAFNATSWISLSLIFLPIFLSSGILLALGVILSRLYYREVKKMNVNFRRLFSSSLDLIIGISYLSIPSLIIYLFLWLGVGLFFLLREIPGIGEFFGIILSFGPFLLIFGSLLLCLFNLALLFFVSPAATLQSLRKGSLAKRTFSTLQSRFFSAICLFLIALIPFLFLITLLCIAALLTSMSFTFADQSLAVAMQWFFIMVPFSAILTPAINFFFNFAFESHLLLRRDETCASQF